MSHSLGLAHGPELSSSLFPQSILDAMDGLAYVTDRDGVLRLIGLPRWNRFADEVGAPDICGERIVGRSIFEMIGGRQVKDVARALHESVWRGQRDEIVFSYRCDAPTLKRNMRMAITPVRANGDIAGVLYQSHLLWETQRPPMDVFNPARRAPGSGSAEAEARVVRLCSYCHDVAWPPGQLTGADVEAWIPPEEYYRRGADADILVSHAICPRCQDALMAEAHGTAVA